MRYLFLITCLHYPLADKYMEITKTIMILNVLSNYKSVNRGIIDIYVCLNTLGPRQNGRTFPDDMFKSIFLKENKFWINISLKFVLKGTN